MIKTFKSERGGMMLLVVGVILMAFILIVPLTMTTSTGQRQSIMDTQYEKAHTKAESVALVFQRMLIEDQADIKGVEDIHEWASRLQGMNLCKDSSVVYNESAALVTVKCTEGSGKVSKTSPVQFQLKYALDNGGSAGGPGAVGGDKFYNKFPVVAKNNSDFDKVYCSAPSTSIETKYISKDYNSAKYNEEFNELLHSFTQDNFTNKMTAPIFPMVIEPEFPTGAAKGEYTYKNSVAGYPTISGSLLRDGNIRIDVDGGKTVRINGDLIASGSIYVYLGDTSSKLVVTGKMHADSISFNNSSSSLISIGKWNSDNWSTGTISNNDKSSLVARKGIAFNSGPISIRVSGDVSAENIQVPSYYYISMKTGGNLITSGDMTFGGVESFRIAGTVAVGGKLTFLNTARDLWIGQSLLVKQEVRFTNTVGEGRGFDVQGDIYVNGNINFDNIIKNFVVGGNVVTKGVSTFKDEVTNMKISGSLVSEGNLTFINTINNVEISGMVLSGGSIGMKTANTLIVKGVLAAGQNIKMENNLSPSARLGGFYAGGNASFPSWYQYDQGKCAIIIDHDPPPAQSAGESVFRIVFGSWKAGN